MSALKDNAQLLIEYAWVDIAGKGYLNPSGKGEIPLTDQRVAEALGWHWATARRYRNVLEKLGLMHIRSEYMYRDRNIFWVLETTYSEAQEAVNAINEDLSLNTFLDGKVSGKRKKTAIASEKDKGEVRAIAGDEAGSPFESLRTMRANDAEALLAAARQYANRANEVTRHIDELRELGVEVDTDKLAKAIIFSRDERLEVVAELVPYFDRIERMNERLIEQNAEFSSTITELRKELEPLRREKNKLIEETKRQSERIAQLTITAS